ncbi:hypothetical protein [Thermophilibacter sp.]|uniref:hypothetical protein n=1 Tax=Thermophilibacter sp. TaxID=2847309 RepID=UPI003A931EE6
MTGIERLREFVAGISPITVVCGVTRTSYDREHMEVAGKRLRDFLADIANQIEREQGERVSRVRILAVVTKMERHVLGHEGMEDSPVARWARELREALGGRGKEVTDVATIRKDAYDAYEWVCEHGGLSHVKDIYHDLRAVVERLGIEWSESELHGLMDALDRRLMPEGMEWLLEVWPKWSNGEYCKFGDWWTADKYGDYEPKQLRRLAFFTPEQLREWEQDEGDNFGYEWDFMRPSDTTYRPDKVEPPAPKVLDADGVEIREGDSVYQMGCKYRVSHLHGANDYVRIVYENSGRWVDPKTLTHHAPVIAADGKPLRKGETVWGTGREEHEYVVLGQPGLGGGAGRFKVACHDVTDDFDCDCDPSLLTHERPESWDRLEDDATVSPETYCVRRGIDMSGINGTHLVLDDTTELMACDLVRRAKALAGVSE